MLTHSELKAFMNERGDEYTDSEITEAIKMADRDGDGKINCAEYKAMMAARYDQIQSRLQRICHSHWEKRA